MVAKLEQIYFVWLKHQLEAFQNAAIMNLEVIAERDQSL